MSSSIIIGKIIAWLLDFFPAFGATALPGLVGLKIDPNLIKKIVSRNQLQSIIITGTNGKTTTSRILGTILASHHISFIHNRTGSNLLRGIASTLINQTNLFGQLNSRLALWEIDEATLLPAIVHLKPSLVLFTNLFRDQLDRYGEIDSVLRLWQQAIQKLPQNTKVIVNVDDPSLNFLAQTAPRQSILTYGLSQELAVSTTPTHASDALFCPRCHQPLQFTYVFISHLSHYYCPNCSFKRPKPYLELETTDLPPSLSGVHNLYNLAAALALVKALHLPFKNVHQTLKQFTPAFGRGESFRLDNKTTQILLIKNPAGANAVLEYLKTEKLLTQPLLIILNDLTADGTDVSWIWDVEFEIFKNRRQPIIVSGLRSSDLALRLKYAGLAPSPIIRPNLNQALNSLKNLPGKTAAILPTYTAMLKLRQVLTKQGLIHSTWQD